MENQPSPPSPEFYQTLPKVELHRHLEGSLRIRTMIEVSRAHDLGLVDTDNLRPLVQVRADDPYTSQNFLSKFKTLREIYRSPEIIMRVTREAIADAAADNVRYMELRFTPVALSRVENFSLGDVIKWVAEATRQAEVYFGIITRLIVSVNRHESVDLAAQVIELAVEQPNGEIVGVDLAGDETQFPASPFADLFQKAKQAGLHVTLHSGEWGGAGNVASAITRFGAERIGHGVRVMEDPAVVSLARDRGTAFEVCVTSNQQSGVVPTLDAHPLPDMLSAGLNVTINTDDPSISQITLSNEYRCVCENLNLPFKTLRERVLAAAKASFLPPSERQNLVANLEKEFPLSS